MSAPTFCGRIPTIFYCLSNALHSSIGQNMKSHPCPLSVVRYPFSGQSVNTSNGHNSAMRHPIPIDFVFGSRLGFLSEDSFI